LLRNFSKSSNASYVMPCVTPRSTKKWVRFGTTKIRRPLRFSNSAKSPCTPLATCVGRANGLDSGASAARAELCKTATTSRQRKDKIRRRIMHLLLDVAPTLGAVGEGFLTGVYPRWGSDGIAAEM